MPDPDQLREHLQFCKREPTDDKPRLTLADWLQSEGEYELGELVRIQVEDHEETHSSNYTWPDREVRERQLMRDHFPEWFGIHWRSSVWCVLPDTPPIGEWSGIKGTGIKTERGLLEVHAKAGEVAQCIAQLPENAHPWIEALSPTFDKDAPEPMLQLLRDPIADLFSNIRFSASKLPAEEVAQWIDRGHNRSLLLSEEPSAEKHLYLLSELTTPRLRYLELTLDEGEIPPNWNEFLRSPLMSELREIYLGTSSDDVIRAVSESLPLSYLDSLSLGGDEFSEEALTQLFRSSSLNRLSKLKVSGYSDSGGSGLGNALAASESLEQLQRLDISSFAFDEESAQAFAHSSALAGVKNLDLDSCEIFSDGAVEILGSPALSHLERLSLLCTNLEEEMVQAIASSPHLSNLRSLSLCRTQLTEAGVHAIVNSPYLANLEELDLSLNPLNDQAMRHLARSPHLKNLRALGLRGISVSGQPLQLFLRSEVASNLIKLDLQSMYLGADQVQALISAELPNLRQVVGYGNRLSDRNAAKLAQAPWLGQLTHLSLSDSQIGDAGMKAILSRLTPGVMMELGLGSNQITKSGFATLLSWPGLQDLVDLGTYGNPFEEELATKLGNVMRRGPW